MKIIKFALLFALIITNQFLFAQDKKDANDILKQVSEKTKSFSSIKVNFTYNMDNPGAKVHESETGTLMVKGDKYRLEISGQTVICDAETSWTYLAESNEVQINSVESSESVITPTKLLSSYSEDYKAKLSGEVTRNGKALYVIELKPNQDKSVTSVELNIDEELLRIMRIAIQDKSGNTFTYIVNKFETNVPVKDTDFSFNPKDYPGVEVIDMR
jgi:outer membrane lipoprotein carrier protein